MKRLLLTTLAITTMIGCGDKYTKPENKFVIPTVTVREKVTQDIINRQGELEKDGAKRNALLLDSTKSTGERLGNLEKAVKTLDSDATEREQEAKRRDLELASELSWVKKNAILTSHQTNNGIFYLPVLFTQFKLQNVWSVNSYPYNISNILGDMRQSEVADYYYKLNISALFSVDNFLKDPNDKNYPVHNLVIFNESDERIATLPLSRVTFAEYLFSSNTAIPKLKVGYEYRNWVNNINVKTSKKMLSYSDASTSSIKSGYSDIDSDFQDLSLTFSRIDSKTFYNSLTSTENTKFKVTINATAPNAKYELYAFANPDLTETQASDPIHFYSANSGTFSTEFSFQSRASNMPITLKLKRMDPKGTFSFISCGNVMDLNQLRSNYSITYTYKCTYSDNAKKKAPEKIIEMKISTTY